MKLCSLVMVKRGQFRYVMTGTFHDILNRLNVTDHMTACIRGSTGEKLGIASGRVIFSVNFESWFQTPATGNSDKS
jgi:hypothetical protein